MNGLVQITQITATELQALLDSSLPPILVQVLPPEVFAATRIPGSCCACVYEVSFLDQIAALTKDKSQTMVLYGAGNNSQDSQTAAEKLQTLGYADIRVFAGGIAAWSAAGLRLDGDGNLPSSPTLDGHFKVNLSESLIRWTGRNLFNHHHGTMLLAGGEIIIREDKLVAASFRIAMNSIQCEDISDSPLNQMLIAHLSSEDFFDTHRYPEAEFAASSIEPLADSTEGTPNYFLRGNLTLRGITHALGFPILVATLDGNQLTAQATLDLDRTQFGSIYGSGKWFRFLGKHVVNDLIHLHLKIHANRSS